MAAIPAHDPSTGPPGSDTVPVRVLLEEHLDELLVACRGGVDIPPRGRFRSFDTTLCGLRRGQLVVLESGPGGGTTSLALNTTRHVALRKKLPVLFFTLQVDRAVLTRLLVAGASGVDPERLRTGGISESDWPKLSHAVGLLAHSPIFVDDDRNATVARIRAKFSGLRASVGPLGLVVVDDLQLLRPEEHSKTTTTEAEASEMSWALKSLAVEFDTPILAVSQRPGAGGKSGRRPLTVEELSGTGPYDGDADVVLIVSHDELGRRGSKPQIIKLSVPGQKNLRRLIHLDRQKLDALSTETRPVQQSLLL